MPFNTLHANGRPPESHFRKALKTAAVMPHRIEQPEVHPWYARMLLDRNHTGDRERARNLLAEARALYEEIGLPRHVEMVDAMGILPE